MHIFYIILGQILRFLNPGPNYYILLFLYIFYLGILIYSYITTIYYTVFYNLVALGIFFSDNHIFWDLM